MARRAISLLGLFAVVWALLMPSGSAQASTAQASTTARAQTRTLAADFQVFAMRADDDGQACDEDEPMPELIACAGELEWTPGEPLLISLMRAFELHMSEAACDELLYDLWSGQACEAGSLECGKMNSAVPPSPAPKLASSSVSARASLDTLSVYPPGSRRSPFVVEQRSPSSRDLPPPTPPPKLQLH